MNGNDLKVVDAWGTKLTNSEGDERKVQIVMCFDIDNNRYVVEKSENGKSQGYDFFDTTCRASMFMITLIADTEQSYADKRREYDKRRVNAAVDGLRDLVDKELERLDPHAAQAISILAEIISRGKAAQVMNDLMCSLNTIYANS
jgi:hypothetical protein